MVSGMYGVSAYQQTDSSWKKTRSQTATVTSKTEQAGSVEQSASAATEKTSMWSFIDTKSSLVPKATEYGFSIGEVGLSDQGKQYYEKLKSKFYNADFILVSKDMKGQVQQNAASYGNANRMVVLIDEEKIERMASDASYRKKYEGIIAMSQTKLESAKNSLAGSGASVKNFGMSVDSDGKESFFATVEKSLDAQKKRIEKKAAQKKEQKAKDKKRAEKEKREERLEKAAQERAEEKKAVEKKTEEVAKTGKTVSERRNSEEVQDREYVTFEAASIDQLLHSVQEYSYDRVFGSVRTDAEKTVGQHIDFKG